MTETPVSTTGEGYRSHLVGEGEGMDARSRATGRFAAMEGRALDHLVVVVHDLDEAAAAFEGAGFVVTPRSDHPFGTSNRLVMDEASYVELITVTDPSAVGASPFARFVADAVSESRTGPLMTVLRSDDLDTDADRLRSAGIDPPEPLRFGRTSILPDGSEAWVEFAILFTSLDSPSFSAFFCRHLTPRLVWHPDTLTHPNGVTALRSIRIPALDDRALDRLAVLAESDPDLPMSLGSTRLEVGASELVFEGATPARTRVDGTSITVVPR